VPKVFIREMDDLNQDVRNADGSCAGQETAVLAMRIAFSQELAPGGRHWQSLASVRAGPGTDVEYGKECR
jgi:hypothetical protein